MRWGPRGGDVYWVGGRSIACKFNRDMDRDIPPSNFIIMRKYHNLLRACSLCFVLKNSIFFD